MDRDAVNAALATIEKETGFRIQVGPVLGNNFIETERYGLDISDPDGGAIVSNGRKLDRVWAVKLGGK